MYICIDEYTQSPPESECHKYDSCIVCDESEGMIIFEESCHGEDITPVVCIFTHTTDERECTGSRIRDIECDICQVLSEPPESYARGVWVMFAQKEHVDYDTWDDELHEAPTEYGE